jgi:hypothetical protein
MVQVRANLAVVRWAEERGLDHRLQSLEIKAQLAKIEEEYLSQFSRGLHGGKATPDPDDLAQSFLRHGPEFDRLSCMCGGGKASPDRVPGAGALSRSLTCPHG